MTLKQALDRIRVDASDAAAWKLIQTELERLAQSVTHDENFQTQAVCAVADKLLDQALSGDLEPIRAPTRYLRTALRWRVLDAVRKQKRKEKALRKVVTSAKTTSGPRMVDPVDPKLFEQMQNVFERALSMRDPWQRHHLERAWGQIQRLHTEPITLPELLIAEDGLDPEDEDAVRRAVQRAYQAHRRCRVALQKALDWLEERKKIDPETAESLRDAIGRLKRCQTRHPSRVYRAKDESR